MSANILHCEDPFFLFQIIKYFGWRYYETMCRTEISPLLFEYFLVFQHQCSRLIMYFPCPNPAISHSSKKHIPFSGEWYLKAKLWMLSVSILIVTDYCCFKPFSVGRPREYMYVCNQSPITAASFFLHVDSYHTTWAPTPHVWPPCQHGNLPCFALHNSFKIKFFQEGKCNLSPSWLYMLIANIYWVLTMCQLMFYGFSMNPQNSPMK